MARTTDDHVSQNASLKNKGFSLIEMLVVMAIMGIILTVSAVSYLTIQKKGRDARRQTDIEQLRTALEVYRAQSGAYPTTAAQNQWYNATTVLNNPLVTPGYMKSIPSDPKQNASYIYPYQYKSYNNWQSYCIVAYFEQGSTLGQCVAPTLPVPTPQYNYRIVNP